MNSTLQYHPKFIQHEKKLLTSLDLTFAPIERNYFLEIQYGDIVGEDKLDQQKSKTLSHLRHMKLVAVTAKGLTLPIGLHRVVSLLLVPMD